MAENQENNKAQTGIDTAFESAEKRLDKLASEGIKVFGLLQIGGDADIKKKVDGIGIDKAFSALSTPYRAMYGISREIRRAGARLESKIEYRRKFAADEYKEGRGPWARGLIYGAPDRLIEDNKYAEGVKKRNTVLVDRQATFRTMEHDILQRMDAAQAAGNFALVRTLQRERRELNRRNRNPELSRGAPTPTDLDRQNIALLDANRDLAIADPGKALPGTRMLKRRRIENAVRVVERKRELAAAVSSNGSGPRRQENHRKKLFNLQADLEAEQAKPIKDRNIKRIIDLEKQIKGMDGVISPSENAVNALLIGSNRFRIVNGRAAA